MIVLDRASGRLSSGRHHNPRTVEAVKVERMHWKDRRR